MAEVIMKKIQHEASNYQKKTKGKQRIVIKRIENKNARLVAFSKRRKTLFTVFQYLAAIVFSEAGKLHCCGHANEDAVIQRFIDYLDKNWDEGIVKIVNNDNCDGFWWDEPIDKLEFVELERFKVALEGLRNKVATTIDEFSCSSVSNGFGDIELGMKMESNVFHPELLPPDAFLNMIINNGLF
ncbi:agamous-like MADS-box protein AGL62 [Silene latifolia]|uniref:agamous-like MADS-box protein AGL62 n=1 Tax=Silene latifolia TaxID=37657 RepID=UPI003D76C4EF